MSKKRVKTKAYIRVSLEKQDLDTFKPEIFKFAAEKGFQITEKDIISEKINGKVHWKKRKVGSLVDMLGNGDNLIIPELSRFSRSIKELLEIIQDLKKASVNIYILKGRLFLGGSVNDPMTKLLMRILSALSEFERDLISMRIKEALKAKKRDPNYRHGRPKGPGKSKLDPFRDEIIELLKAGMATKAAICRKYGTTAGNLRNWLMKNQIGI